MRTIVALTALLLPLVTGAGVYKWVGPDGLPHYSDRPISGAEPVDIPVGEGGERAQEVSSRPAAAGADPGPYDSFEIVVPEPNQTLHDAKGELGLSLLIDPPLSADHHLQILLDGQGLSGQAQGAQLLLRGINFGSHRLQARILDETDTAIASSAVVDFHLRQPAPETDAP